MGVDSRPVKRHQHQLQLLPTPALPSPPQSPLRRRMDDFDIQLNALPFGSCPSAKREENDEVVFSNIWPSDTFCEHEVTSGNVMIPQVDAKLDIPLVRSERQNFSSRIGSPDSGFWSIGSLESNTLSQKLQFESNQRNLVKRNSELYSDTESSEGSLLNGKPQFNTRLGSLGMASSEKQNISSQVSAPESDSQHGNRTAVENKSKSVVELQGAAESSPKVKLRGSKGETSGEEENRVNASSEGGQPVANSIPHSTKRNSKDILEHKEGVVEKAAEEKKKRPLSSSIRSIQARFSAPTTPQEPLRSNKRNSRELASERKRESAELKSTPTVQDGQGTQKSSSTPDNSSYVNRLERDVPQVGEEASKSNNGSSEKIMSPNAGEEDVGNKATDTAAQWSDRFRGQPMETPESTNALKNNSAQEPIINSHLSKTETEQKPAKQEEKESKEDKADEKVSDKKKRPLSSSILAIQARLMNSCPNDAAQDNLKPKKPKSNRNSDAALEEKIKSSDTGPAKAIMGKSEPDKSDKPNEFHVKDIKQEQPSTTMQLGSHPVLQSLDGVVGAPTKDLPGSDQGKESFSEKPSTRNAMQQSQEPSDTNSESVGLQDDRMEMFEATVVCQTSSRIEPPKDIDAIKGGLASDTVVLVMRNQKDQKRLIRSPPLSQSEQFLRKVQE